MPYYIAEGAVVKGRVSIGEDSGVWYNATVRGDLEPIVIGAGSNVQDNAVVHVDPGFPVVIGDRVTIGHGAIIHGCTIGDDCLIGMGAIILNGAVIGKGSIVGAGALVTQNVQIPEDSMVYGSPAKVVRQVRPQELEASRKNAREYVQLAQEQLCGITRSRPGDV